MENSHQTTSNNFREATKIKPIECYTKIQEANPAHCSNLINKQLGYNALIEYAEGTEPYKLKNCICSARPNSELFKRFSRNLISNIKNEVDHLFFFTSVNPLARLETSIGLQTNPGIFLIIGLTFLDQKYKESYQRCDIEFCFLEFKEGQMYDLLCYTEQPLVPQRDSNNHGNINFKEHWVKTTTFNQFIKLFKIALFNNKERDFKSDHRNSRCKSTFIMKIRSKIYNIEEELIKEQETVLIDFEQNCMKENTFANKDKISRSIFDYILIEMNNSHPSNKPIHYHLVQENLLLLFIRKYLNRNQMQRKENDHQRRNPASVGGQITIINSFAAEKQSFLINYAFLQNIQNHIGQPWESIVKTRNKKARFFNHYYVQTQLRSIAQGISNHTYSSLRNFNTFKLQLISEIKKCRQITKQLRKIAHHYIREKMELHFLKNQLIAYEVKLIGSCIKSDHFKDFYNAKSYLQLEREIKIKTEQIRDEIKSKLSLMEVIEKKFFAMRAKEQQNYEKIKQSTKTQPYQTQNIVQTINSFTPFSSISQTKQGWNTKTATDSKFKKLSMIKSQVNQLDQLRFLINYLHEYMYSLWESISLSQERTSAGNIIFDEGILKEEGQLCEMINHFIDEIGNINETDIMYEQENNIYNNNQIALFRSLNFLGLLGPKKTVKGLQIGKRLMLKTEGNKPKMTKIQQKKCKLPSISSKDIVIVGDLRMSDLLTNPHKSESLLFHSNSQLKL